MLPPPSSMLYSGSDVIRDLEWVIFDEVHYINDAEVSGGGLVTHAEDLAALCSLTDLSPPCVSSVGSCGRRCSSCCLTTSPSSF